MTNKKSKTALITGASSGIGMALALELAKKGYNLILMARRESILTDWAQFVESRYSHIKLLIVKSDVSDHKAHIEDVKKAVNQFESLDLVVANAGIGYNTSEWENTWEDSKKIFDVNLYGAIVTIETCKDIFLKQGYGHIVGISSMAAIRGISQVSAYCASKSGLATFLEAMRIDLIDKKIPVLTVHPGYVKTPMTEQNGAMPWLVSAEDAAKLIFKAIKKKKARLYFPWQMLVINYLGRVVPNAVFDFIVKLARKRIFAFRKNR